MRIMNKLTLIFIILCLVLFMANSFGQDQEERKIKMKDYKVQLAEWQSREAVAKGTISELQASIDQVNGETAVVQGEIDATWGEIYSLIETDKAGVDAYRSNLEGIDNKLDGLAALTPEELFRSSDELEVLEGQIEEAKKSNIYILSEMVNNVEELEGKVAALKAKMPANVFDQYSVVEGDNLWNISKKEEIYSNPFQWIRIYCVNKDQIKDPDLIYSDQIFNIARGVARNEHLIVKGDYLSKISGMAKIFNDPTKWTKLYEANKDVIEDPNLIYPYQVITIPKN